MALIYLSFLLTSSIVCCCAIDGKSDARSNEEERAILSTLFIRRPSHVLRGPRLRTRRCYLRRTSCTLYIWVHTHPVAGYGGNGDATTTTTLDYGTQRPPFSRICSLPGHDLSYVLWRRRNERVPFCNENGKSVAVAAAAAACQRQRDDVGHELELVVGEARAETRGVYECVRRSVLGVEDERIVTTLSIRVTSK